MLFFSGCQKTISNFKGVNCSGKRTVITHFAVPLRYNELDSVTNLVIITFQSILTGLCTDLTEHSSLFPDEIRQ